MSHASRTRNRSVVAGLALLLSVCASARSAHAEDALSFRYERNEGVEPDARAATDILRRRVKTISAEAEDAGESAGVIRVEKRADECVAFAELTRPPLEGERLMRAPTCEQALEALGVSLSILLNQPPVAAPPPAEGATAPVAPVTAPVHEEDSAHEDGRLKRRVGLGVRGGFDRGYVPGQVFGSGSIELFGRYEFDRVWEVELGFHRQLERYVDFRSAIPTYADVSGHLSTWAITGRFCRLSARSEAVLLLRGCVRGEVVDQTFSRAEDMPASSSHRIWSGDYETYVWPVVGVEGGVRLSGAKTHAGPYAEANLALTTAPVRPRWILDDGRQVFRPDAVQVSASIGAGYRF